MSDVFWNKNVGERSRNSKLPKQVDILVIGGGLSGSSVVYWLSELYQHASILLLERGELASGATGKNGGHLKPVNTQEELCARDLIRVITENDLISDVELFIHQESPLGAQVHPVKLVLALCNLATRNKNVSIKTNCTVMKIDETIESHYDVQTSEGYIHAKKVIVTTNGFTNNLFPHLKEIIYPVRAQCVATEPLDINNLIFPTNSNHFERKHDMYILQRRTDGRIIAGGFRRSVPGEEENIDDDSVINSTISNHLKQWLIEDPRIKAKNIPNIKIEYEWTGIMGFTKDKNPLIGKLKDNLFISAGFNGHGMPVCFWASKTIACLLSYPNDDFLDNKLLSPYLIHSPQRFNFQQSKL